MDKMQHQLGRSPPSLMISQNTLPVAPCKYGACCSQSQVQYQQSWIITLRLGSCSIGTA
jgi:hypothetical protein